MDSFPVLGALKRIEWWTTVFKVLFSKSLLISVSIINFIIYILSSFQKNKSGNLKTNAEEYLQSPETFAVEQESSQSSLNVTGKSEIDESDLVSARERLSEVKSRSDALKVELQELNNLRFSLEERCRQKEREKAEVEDELEETELLAAIQIEELKKEKAILKRSLEKANKEKDMLSCEAENSTREEKLTNFALKAHTVLVESLERVREDILKMEVSLKDLQMQRDRAVALADRLTRSRNSPEVKEKQTEESPIGNCGTVTRDSIWKEQFSSLVDSESNMCLLLERHVADIASSITFSDDEARTKLKFGPVTGSIAFRNFVLSMIMEK